MAARLRGKERRAHSDCHLQPARVVVSRKTWTSYVTEAVFIQLHAAVVVIDLRVIIGVVPYISRRLPMLILCHERGPPG